MKLFAAEKSNASKEEVVAAAVAASSPVPTDGVTCTVVELTLGFNAAPLLSTPTPVTEYSHPVL